MKTREEILKKLGELNDLYVRKMVEEKKALLRNNWELQNEIADDISDIGTEIKALEWVLDEETSDGSKTKTDDTA